ncbi:MAG: KTSC domain-containing protein [Myxococcota bacterium]
MDRTEVESGALRSVGYDAESETLEVEFRSGKIYRYRGVPSSTHEWLMRAPAKGTFFNTKIEGHYEFERIDHLQGLSANQPSLEDALRASLAAKASDDDPA